MTHETNRIRASLRRIVADEGVAKIGDASATPSTAKLPPRTALGPPRRRMSFKCWRGVSMPDTESPFT